MLEVIQIFEKSSKMIYKKKEEEGTTRCSVKVFLVASYNLKTKCCR